MPRVRPSRPLVGAAAVPPRPPHAGAPRSPTPPIDGLDAPRVHGATPLPPGRSTSGGSLLAARLWNRTPVSTTTSTLTSSPPIAGPTTATTDAPSTYVPAGPYPGLTNGALLSALRASAKPTVHHSYKTARGFLFGKVDNTSGVVRSIYSHRTLHTHGIPSADGPDGMNTEHTFPQSWLQSRPDAISDLHHLFISDTDANSARSSYPFGEVVDATWVSDDGQSRLGTDTSGATVFEPPVEHRGNIARAMFYVSALYDVHIHAHHEAVLRTWADADPVDPEEVQRNARVAAVQGNTNPFIDAPALEKRIADF